MIFRSPLLPALLSGLVTLTSQAADAGAHGNPQPDKSRGGQLLTEPAPSWSREVFAPSNLAKNVAALEVDPAGHVFVCETNRWRKGIEDNRDHRYWLADDLASRTVADRAAYYAKWEASRLEAGFFTKHSERVVRLTDSDQDGKADQSTIFRDDFSASVDGPAIGLLERHGMIWLTSIPSVYLLQDKDGDGVAEEKETLLTGFGVKTSLSGHDLHGLAFGMDGKFYFSLGDRGFTVETKEGTVLSNPNSGAIFRCNPDGSELEIWHHNTRNPQELAFNELGDLFTVDNNCDQGDQARIVYLMEGGDTGWTIGTQVLTTFRDDADHGGLAKKPYWLSEEQWKPGHKNAELLPPVSLLTNGPSGLLFNSGHNLPERYRNHFLVCDYEGSPAQCELFSFRVEPRGAGYSAVDQHVFLSGIATPDVALGYDGKFYVADFGGGWTLSDRGGVHAVWDPEGLKNPVVLEVSELFKNGFDTLNSERLGELLAHPDIRVRREAHFQLAERGAASLPVLTRIAKSGKTTLERLHAIWALRMVKEGKEILPFTADKDPEVRAQAIKMLGDLKEKSAAAEAARLCQDESPRVRAFAAIAAGRIGDQSALSAVVELLKNNKENDPFLRHAGAVGLAGMCDSTGLAQLAADSNAAVRLGALLAAGQNRDEAVSTFLNDQEPTIFETAVRIIHDQDIESAIPALARTAARLAEDDKNIPATIRSRMINACLRDNDAEAALVLSQIAASRKAGTETRTDALRFLAHWPAPPPVDPAIGVWRGKGGERKTEEARPKIEAAILALLEKDQDFSQAQLSPVLQVSTSWNVDIPDQELTSWITQEKLPVESRLAALKLHGEHLKGVSPVWAELIEKAPVELAAEAAGLAIRDQKTAPDNLRALWNRGDLTARRKTLELIAQDTSPALVPLLNELQRTQTEKPEHELDLDFFGAVGAHLTDPGINAEAVAWHAQLNGDPIGAMSLTRFGGNPTRGLDVFNNQGTCRKCHRDGSTGGAAGPDLSGVATRLSPDHLLESLVEPAKAIVPGYGMISITRKSGDIVAGVLEEETQSALTIKTGENETVTVPIDEIATRTPVLSAMPPMGLALSKQDVRDLMAYLATLK